MFFQVNLPELYLECDGGGQFLFHIFARTDCVPFLYSNLFMKTK